jgi:membrane protein implicated in regulation of membrane protease activity
MEIATDHIWMLLGAALMTAELFLAGFGLLFMGLGAITVGIAINFLFLAANDYTVQFGWFFAATGGWLAILWLPLKKYIRNRTEPEYSNMIGAQAVIIEGDLEKDKLGKVRWSGTIMNARITHTSHKTHYKEGSEVVIKAVEGNTLFVE